MWVIYISLKQKETRTPTFRTVEEISSLVHWVANEPEKAIETGTKIVGFGLFVILLAAAFIE